MNLEPNTYSYLKKIAKSLDLSLSAVINQKLSESLFGDSVSSQTGTRKKNGLLISSSNTRVTREMVSKALEEDE